MSDPATRLPLQAEGAPMEPVKRGRGRPKHQPTPELRAKVCAWLARGMTEDEVAAKIGVAPHTLRKHYRVELDTVLDLQDSEVRKAFLNRCMGFERKGKYYPPSETLLALYARTRLGFVERTEHDHNVRFPIGETITKEVAAAELQRATTALQRHLRVVPTGPAQEPERKAG